MSAARTGAGKPIPPLAHMQHLAFAAFVALHLAKLYAGSSHDVGHASKVSVELQRVIRFTSSMVLGVLNMRTHTRGDFEWATRSAENADAVLRDIARSAAVSHKELCPVEYLRGLCRQALIVENFFEGEGAARRAAQRVGLRIVPAPKPTVH